MRERVGKRVNEFLAGQRPLLDDVSPDVGGLVDPLTDFMAGGKKLRAMFLYWGWRAAGGPDCDEVIGAASAMEFLQACALVHDDVMDRSDSRRGRPAMHRQFTDMHARASWAGSPDDFGAAAAILLGDLCLSWADELLMGCGLPTAALQRGKPVYDTLRTELMAGQYLDILEQVRRNTAVEPALQVARFKSAKYTIERPLHLGAALADADPGLVTALRDYGLSLGVAFQLRDDLLGVYGDPDTTGKPAGDDLREGKRTALVAFALSDLDDDGRAALAADLESTSTDPARVRRMRTLVDSTDARLRVESLIDDYAARAGDVLAASDADPQARDVLNQLITAATSRVA